MNRVEAEDQMLTHAQAACTEAGLTVVWSNIPDQQPDQINWAQVYVKHTGEGRQRGFTARGLRRYREKGNLWIKIHVLIGDGTSTTTPITQKVLEYFRKLRISNISYVNIRAVEDKAHGRFFVTDFIADFSYDVFN